MVMKDEQWDDVIAVNLTSTFMLMRAAARAMMRAKTGYRPHHQHLLGSGIFGNPGPGQLRRLQGRHDRHDQDRSPARSPRAASRPTASRPGFISTPMTDALNEKQTEAITR